MSRFETQLPALVWGRRSSDHFQGNDRRRSQPETHAITRHDAGLLAQVIATHIGVEHTRQRRRETPEHANAAYKAASSYGVTQPAASVVAEF